jgi:hypothetical protein
MWMLMYFVLLLLLPGLNVTLPLALGCEGPILILVFEQVQAVVPKLIVFVESAAVFPFAYT